MADARGYLRKPDYRRHALVPAPTWLKQLALLAVVAATAVGLAWYLTTRGAGVSRPTALTTATPTAHAAPPGQQECSWLLTNATAASGFPHDYVLAEGVARATIDTDAGRIVAVIELATDGCAAENFRHLGATHYYDGMRCPATGGVIRCIERGDPGYGFGAAGDGLTIEITDPSAFAGSTNLAGVGLLCPTYAR
jgi:hypothetical protein